MEPIKVDFSGNGKKKSVKDSLIPPDKAGMKTVISVIVTVIGAFIAYYFMLPPLNLRSYDFYFYIGVVIAIFVAATFLTSGALRRPEFVPYVKKRATVPVLIAVAGVLLMVVGYLSSCAFFRAKSLAGVLQYNVSSSQDNKVFEMIESVSDLENLPVIDAGTAQAYANKALGDFRAMKLESQYELNVDDSTQINFGGVPYRVFPLKYGSIFKWFNNVFSKDYDGIPGYVMVDLRNGETYLETKYQIKYSTAEHFGDNLERYLRKKHPGTLFGEMSFELKEVYGENGEIISGEPWWVVEVIDKKVGLFGGDDVKGVILVRANDGYIEEYSIENCPAWVDQAYDAELLLKQYKNNGKYTNGFLNAVFTQNEVRQASDGYSFIVKGDDVYLYTGVTSVSEDDSLIGFLFINQRTKEAHLFEMSGATEAAAQASAQGKVSDLGWQASFPIMIDLGVDQNGSHQYTFFMSLKDASNVVKSYAMVNVKQYSIVAVPASRDDNKSACFTEYKTELEKQGVKIGKISEDSPSQPEDTEYVSGVISDIRSAVIGGSTYYYIQLEGSSVYYYVAAGEKSAVTLFDKGDTVRLLPAETEGDILTATDAEFDTPAQPAQETAPAEDVTETAPAGENGDE